MRCCSVLAVLALGCGAAGLTGCAESATPIERAGTGSRTTPSRVVVLAPAAAEMLAALDLADRVVGVGDYGPWPEAMAARPSVGGYADPNVERALSLEAQVVLTAASQAAAHAHRALEEVGIAVESLDTSTYEGVFLSLARIGVLFDRESEAAEIALTMQNALDGIERAAADAPRRSVLFVVGRDPLFVAGPGSHIDQMIGLVGGENVASDLMAPYQQMSLEAVLERRPEVIIDTSDNRGDGSHGRVPGSWARWEFLPAVANERVYRVEPGRLVVPGLRLPEMTGLVGKLVQPEIFGEVLDSELD